MTDMNLRAGGEAPVVGRPQDDADSEPGRFAKEGSLLVLVIGLPSLLRDCLVSVLDQEVGVEVVGVAATADEAQTAVAGAQPDVVVIDPRLADGSGLTLVQRLRDSDAETRVLVVSEDQSPHMVQRAFRAGANSVVCPWCTGEAFMDAVRRTAVGETVVGPDLVEQLVAAASAATPSVVDLSAREQEVLGHISRGATNAEIARQLDVSIRTVQKHLENLFRQFGVHERAALVAEAFRQGLLS